MGQYDRKLDLPIKIFLKSPSMWAPALVYRQIDGQTRSHIRDAFLLCEESLKVLCLPSILVGKLYSIVHKFSVVKQYQVFTAVFNLPLGPLETMTNSKCA